MMVLLSSEGGVAMLRVMMAALLAAWPLTGAMAQKISLTQKQRQAWRQAASA